MPDIVMKDFAEPVHIFGTDADPGIDLPNSAADHTSSTLVLPRGKTCDITILFDFTGVPVGDAPYVECAHKKDADAAPRFTPYDSLPDQEAPAGAVLRGGWEIRSCAWTHLRVVYPHTSGVGALQATAYMTRVVP